MDTSEKYTLRQEDRLAGNRARWKDYIKLQLICSECGTTFTKPPSVVKLGKGKYCSQICANRAKGRTVSIPRQLRSNGYVYVKTWDHPFRSKQNLIAEHRLVVEKKIGRFLTRREMVHHIDRIKTNNSADNLFLCRNNTEHRIIEKIDPIFLKMFNCARYDNWDTFDSFDVIKNRQDQLQDMVACLGIHDMIYTFMEFYSSHWTTLSEPPIRPSMEQLWLAFVMHKKFHKTWNDKKGWV